MSRIRIFEVHTDEERRLFTTEERALYYIREFLPHLDNSEEKPVFHRVAFIEGEISELVEEE